MTGGDQGKKKGGNQGGKPQQPSPKKSGKQAQPATQPATQPTKQQPSPKASGKNAAKKEKEIEVSTPGAAGAGAFQFNFKPGQTIDFSQDIPNLEAALKSTKVDKSATLPVSVQNRVKALKKLNEERTKLYEQFEKEVKALELKYEGLYNPLYDRRTAIVDGSVEPTAEEVGTPAEGAKDEIKGIPDFWLNALKEHPSLEEEITPRDEPLLKFLKDIKAKSAADSDNFTLEFHFAENPYFENKVLTKTYFMVADEATKEITYDKSEGTKINWKEGKNITVNLIKKKPKKGGRNRGGNQKPKTVEEKCKSFFNFFSTIPIPTDLNAIDDETLEEIEALIEIDYDNGMLIKERIVPEAVLFFTGEAQIGDEDDEYGGLFGDEDDDDDLEDDDDEVEEEDDDDDDAPAAAGAAPAQQPAECKQQ